MFRAVSFQSFILWGHRTGSQANSADAEKFSFSVWAERRLGASFPLPLQRTRLPLVLRGVLSLSSGMTSKGRPCQQPFILLSLVHCEQQQDPSSKLEVIPSKWTFGKCRGWTSVAADLSKEDLGKMKRAGLCSFLPAEFVITLDSARTEVFIICS